MYELQGKERAGVGESLRSELTFHSHLLDLIHLLS